MIFGSDIFEDYVGELQMATAVATGLEEHQGNVSLRAYNFFNHPLSPNFQYLHLLLPKLHLTVMKQISLLSRAPALKAELLPDYKIGGSQHTSGQVCWICPGTGQKPFSHVRHLAGTGRRSGSKGSQGQATR